MNVIELYDQFTTTWEKIRADILSHAIAAGLLWFIGFAPPLPDIGLADIAELQKHPVYPMFQGVGFLALASLGIALSVGAYAIALREVGRFLLTGVIILIPPVLSLSRSRRLIPRGSLFNIAATLEGGIYQARDLESQMHKLLATYAVTQPEELKNSLSSQKEMQRDSSTHLRNATVFVSAWISAPWLLPESSPLALALEEAFWSGLGVLMIYLVIARARLLFGLQLALAWSAQAAATLVQKDDFYTDRLIAAQANPKPYRDLIHRYLSEEGDDTTPSLLAYFGAHVGRETADANGELITERAKLGPIRAAFRELRRFGWDEEENRDYEDPAWLLRYAGWRAVRAFDVIRKLPKVILTVLGLWRP